MVSPTVPSTTAPLGATRFASVDELYADPRRRRSRERDVGLQWRARDGMTYRAAWIEETEELYAVAHLDGAGRGGRVQILGRIPRETLERVLPAWIPRCGEPGSFEWLCRQARQLDRR